MQAQVTPNMKPTKMTRLSFGRCSINSGRLSSDSYLHQPIQRKRPNPGDQQGKELEADENTRGMGG